MLSMVQQPSSASSKSCTSGKFCTGAQAPKLWGVKVKVTELLFGPDRWMSVMLNDESGVPSQR